jgi:hypothetical protein
MAGGDGLHRPPPPLLLLLLLNDQRPRHSTLKKLNKNKTKIINNN